MSTSINYSYTQGTSLGFDVVDLATAKANSNIEYSDQDGLLQIILGGSVDYCEKYCSIDVVGRENSVVKVNRWANKFYLPVGVVREVVSVAYKDENGADQEINSDDYNLFHFEGPVNPVIQFNLSSFPALETDNPMPITITLNTGYANADSVPNVIKQAVLLLFSKNESRREDGAVKGNTQARSLLSSFKRRS